MKEIKLTKGQVALVDDADYEFLIKFKWCANKGVRNKTYYAVRGIREGDKTRRVFMHRVIAQAGRGELVDHWNHNTLDNRRDNLRVGNQSLNQMNRLPQGGLSKYKGVSFYSWTMQWAASCCGAHIGYFDNEIDAARAYNAVAYEKSGDWALLNDIPGLSKEELISLPDSYNPKIRKNKYRGVRHRSKNSWEAYIQYRNSRFVIGCFDSEDKAVRSYNNKCDELGCPERKNDINEIYEQVSLFCQNEDELPL